MKKIAKIASAAVATLLTANAPVHAASRSDGTVAFTSDNHVVAENRTRSLAERGDAQAQALLGFMYEHGRAVAQNYDAAVYWYSCAAEQGHPTAQYLLGLMYDKGHGVVRNNVLAYKWPNRNGSHPVLCRRRTIALAGKMIARETCCVSDRNFSLSWHMHSSARDRG